MEHRRRISGTFPGLLAAILVASLSVLNGCGGGTGGGTSSNAVNVSLASAPGFPAGTTFAPTTLSPDTAAPPANSPAFDNVFVTVTKLALIPSTGTELPDANGELETPDSSEKVGNGFVTATLPSPVKIDLKNLSGDNVAMLLNQFSGVPAGEYSKIRVYYSSVNGHDAGPPPADTEFHQTAHYHFDVHFVGGNLVIPVTSAPQGGIRFFSVVINVVGLKIQAAGNSGNVLLRPQVFATVDNTVLEFIITGTADNVAIDGTFDILALGGRSIPAAFSVTGTTWAYSDDVLNNSPMVHGRDKSIAVPAFKDRAEVSAIGVFDTNLRLRASHITFTFPDFRIGKVFSTWSADNTFFRLNLPLPLDNLVYALPDKTNPLYTDFRVPPLELLNGYDLIVPNPDNTVKARGYDFTGSQGAGLQAFWISVDNNIVP